MTSYLRTLAAAFVALLLLVGALNWLIDPYDYWGTAKIEGLNRYKPAVGKHMLAVKQRQYDRIRPATLIAGNSRVEVGFDPASPAWPAEARPVYNLGLPGMGLSDVVDAALAAADRHKPRRLYVGVDAFDFMIHAEDWRAWRPAPPKAANQGPLDTAAQWVRVTLSLSALIDAGTTVLEQHRPYPAHTTPAGYNGLFHYPAIVAAEGHALLFAQNNSQSAERHALRGKAVRWPGPGGSREIAALDRLAAGARARGIELAVFTYPYHAEVLRVADEAGLLPAITDFRRLLIAWSARTGVPVWDFNRLNATTTEPVPPPGDTTTQMRWYWEGGHFKASLGTEMVRVMTGAAPPGPLGGPLGTAAIPGIERPRPAAMSRS